MGVSNELVALIRASRGVEGEVEETQEEVQNELVNLIRPGGEARPQQTTFSRKPEQDVGVTRAFGIGLKEGVVSPFDLITRREAPVHDIDETGEKVANFLGSMVGLGLSFIPFSVGTGAVLKGIGLAGKVSERTFRMYQYTAAGALQFAGESESLEEVPKNLAAGVVFGGAIEVGGLLIGRAMRARSGDIARGAERAIDNGSPTPDLPVSGEHVGKENALSVTEGMTRGRAEETSRMMLDDGLLTDEMLVQLADVQEEAIRIPNLADPSLVIAAARQRLPNSRTLVRRMENPEAGFEVLVQNPADPNRFLSPKQEAQWVANGVFDGMQVMYRDKIHAATGLVTKDGFIQMRSNTNPNLVFLGNKRHIIRPTEVFPSLTREQVRNQIGDYIDALGQRNVGYSVRAGDGLVQEGVVDIRDFSVVKNMDEFIEQNKRELLNIEAQDIETAVRELAERQGIRGLLYKDRGVTTGVKVFDQSVVSSKKVIDDFGVSPNRAVTYVDEAGELVVDEFVPSWRNSLLVSLKEQGIPEDQITVYLEGYRIQMDETLRNAMDKDMRDIIDFAEIKFREGCL